MREAVRRATMDIGTARDMINDVLEERNALLVNERVLLDKIRRLEEAIRQLQVDRDQWQRQAISRD